MRRLFALVFAAWTCAAAVGEAQTVRGTVVDLSDRPLSGVVVLLVDAGTREVARSLTNDRGEYFLTAPAPGSYRLRTLRIGFRSVITRPIELAAGATATQRIALSGLAFALDTVRAVGRNACRVVAGDSTSMVAALWDQIRTALIATQVSLSDRNLFITTLLYDRTMDPRSQRIGRQDVDIRSHLVRQPWRSLSPDSLRKAGYVYNVDEVRTYNAPDIDVLLSLQFLEDHCLRIASRSEERR